MAKTTLSKDYKSQQENIANDNYTYTDKEMKTVYKDQKAELDSLHSFIGMLFIKYSTGGLLKLNTTQKATITSQVKSKLVTMGKKLNNVEIEAVTGILTDVFKETYNKNAFILNQDFKELDKKIIANSVTSKTKGESFSSRITTNKADLIDKLQDHIKTALLGAITIDILGSQIQDRFSITANETKCLSDTEVARVTGDASNEVAKDSGCNTHQWSATLDDTTCDECGELDGQIFDIDDSSAPDMPLHPNDRCCWIIIPYTGWKATDRKDNSDKSVISYVDYNTWKENK